LKLLEEGIAKLCQESKEKGGNQDLGERDYLENGVIEIQRTL
jgi:hypothetical protein